MDDSQYRNFIYELGKINTRLNKIIELLELRNSIEVARDEMRTRVSGPAPIVVSKETAR